MSGLDEGATALPGTIGDLKRQADLKRHRLEGQGNPEVAGLLVCVGAASHWPDLGLKRLRRLHKRPKWLD